jgi:hypothetical protein
MVTQTLSRWARVQPNEGCTPRELDALNFIGAPFEDVSWRLAGSG